MITQKHLFTGFSSDILEVVYLRTRSNVLEVQTPTKAIRF